MEPGAKCQPRPRSLLFVDWIFRINWAPKGGDACSPGLPSMSFVSSLAGVESTSTRCYHEAAKQWDEGGQTYFNRVPANKAGGFIPRWFGVRACRKEPSPCNHKTDGMGRTNQNQKHQVERIGWNCLLYRLRNGRPESGRIRGSKTGKARASL